ncbi:survival of motor neuron-related-splicing factor 30-like [Tubulanus polymorphus]|uniref:survival of motor neuron-related-splicing factor 30-like n=1 Tax=Tubulanus polymorphus TaxID=672921 RepID=UPI003DA217CB
MAEELQANVDSYRLQLQQVEAALTTDPGNDDLLKLKKDLKEVLDLTEDLITQHELGLAVAATEGATGDNETADKSSSSSTATSTAVKSVASRPQLTESVGWKVGDYCLAAWSSDGFDYEAIIDEVLDDGTCTVTFTDSSDITEIVPLSSLKRAPGGNRRKAEGEDGIGPKKMKKKDWIAQQREYKRKKSQKKAQRMKQMEEEREHEKNKWINFHTKVTKGKTKKSIFASPAATNSLGRVGVGTCGVSGQPMTQYSSQKKWRK